MIDVERILIQLAVLLAVAMSLALWKIVDIFLWLAYLFL